MSKSVWVIVLCSALAGCVTGHSSTRAVARDIEDASTRFIEARQSRDAASFAALFTDDGIYMIPGLADAAGRPAVENLARQKFGGAASTDFVVHRREIDVADDAAHELAWFAETTMSHRMEGRHLIVWKRGSDGDWKVRRYLYNFADAKPLP